MDFDVADQPCSDERLLLFTWLAFLHHLQGVGGDVMASVPTAGDA